MSRTNIVLCSGDNAEENGEFACSMHSVILSSNKKQAFITQQPKYSVAGERPSSMSPWVMPMWIYNYSFLQSKDPASGVATTRALKVGDEIRIGGSDSNFVMACIEEVAIIDAITNSTGLIVAIASQ